MTQDGCKLLIYGPYYAPEVVGVGKYSSEMAEWLVQHGHEVTVVTTPPHNPEGVVPANWRFWRSRAEQRAGVKVVYCPLWLPRRLGLITRLLAYGTWVLRSQRQLIKALRTRPHILMVLEPTILAQPLAWLWARVFHVKLWLHVQDFELGAAIGSGYLRARWPLRLLEAIEGLLLRRMDRVSTISPAMHARLTRLGVPAKRQFNLPNWVNCEEIRPLERPSSLRSELGLATDAKVALYAGSFGRKHGLEVLIETARLLQGRSDLRFVFAGAGPERNSLEIAAQNLSNISWLPLQPSDRLNELLNLADIHLLPQKPGLIDSVLPSKLTGMLASGRPVIGPAAPSHPAAAILARAGIALKENNPTEFVEAIKYLLTAPQHCQSLGATGRRIAEEELAIDPILSRLEVALRASSIATQP